MRTSSPAGGAAPVAPRPWARWLGRLAWLAWIGVAAAAAARLAGQAGDDIYITYRYAYNLAHGRGMVFNPGERVFGVSDPGVAVLLAGLHRATGLPIPVLGTAATALALLVIAGVLLAAARAAGREAEGWIGGTLLLASAYVWLGQGAGPLPALALLLLAARLAGGRRPWAAGGLAGLAFCCRPDAALGAAALGLLLLGEDPRAGTQAGDDRRPRPSRSAPRGILARGWPRLARPLAYGAAFALVAGMGLAAAWSWFGSPLPATLAVKRHFAALAPEDFTGWAFWRPAGELFCSLAGRGGPALLAMGVAGQLPLYLRGGLAGRLLVLHSLALTVFYTLAELPFFIWYTLPTAIAVLYGAAFLCGSLTRGGLVAGADAARPAANLPGAGLPGAGRPGAGELAAGRPDADWPRAVRRARRAVLLAAAAAVAAGVFAPAMVAGYGWWSGGGSRDWRLFAYRQAGEWIRAHTPPGADVAFDEVGILGYYADRPVRDLIGLVTPRSRPFAAVGDPLGAFLASPPELLLFHTYDRRGGTRPILIRPWFAAAYEQVATLPDPAARAETRIYRRRPGAVLPPPRPPWPRPRRAR
jgi:hypothetical protein